MSLTDASGGFMVPFRWTRRSCSPPRDDQSVTAHQPERHRHGRLERRQLGGCDRPVDGRGHRGRGNVSDDRSAGDHDLLGRGVRSLLVRGRDGRRRFHRGFRGCWPTAPTSSGDGVHHGHRLRPAVRDHHRPRRRRLDRRVGDHRRVRPGRRLHVQNALPPRFSDRAQWCANLAVINLMSQMETTAGARLFPELSEGRLLNKPINELSNMDGVINAAAETTSSCTGRSRTL